ncbi:MAG: hypothetical protein AAGH19_02145 [Pseudomonadota bacterium]
MSERSAYLAALGLTDWVRRGSDAPTEERPATAGPASNEPASDGPASDGPGATKTATPTPTVERSAPQEPIADAKSPGRAGITLGPGKGSCLFLCAPGDDESSALASDLARVLGEPPVWAHLASDQSGQPLELAIAERLFTQVVVFGEAAARLVFDGAPPPTCGPARVTVVDALTRLGRDAGARRSCWMAFKAAGLVPRP